MVSLSRDPGLSLNKAHLERGKAEPTEVWLHLEPRPGR